MEEIGPDGKSCRSHDEPMIVIREVHKSFGQNHVLRGVNLEVKCGETMAVIGGSGTGKSVLLKCIIGLLRHDRGEIYVDGQEISHLKEKNWNALLSKFGMVFQRDALFDSITIWENVGFGLRQHTRLPDEEIKAIAIEKLKLVGLENVEDRMPAELSGGMRKRVSLARAIAMEPSIILYDEPTTGLDPIMANVINDLMVRMREKLEVTSIVITHDMESAYHIADHIAMLYQGEIIEVGTPGQIKSSSHEIVRQFIHGEVEGPITKGADFGQEHLTSHRR
ncbi:MAG TPA: ABC transporter ATP-binding protein [Thermodesulfobacteriota bacterium]|nr:ABC transporter ATP-binding protein [Thermodesulfobacteriota bacterium]